ncbi:hypothetical protein F5B19DRAFT_81119 [Rostrohypoxylon terebratum]|nr:hypothetical protein F5B19DRAFT_81119 [Rostrohypoxylon terebratum]
MGCKCQGQLCLVNALNVEPVADPGIQLYLNPAQLRNKAKMAHSHCFSICSDWKAHIHYQPIGPPSSETRHHKDILICLPPEQIFHMLMMTFYIRCKGKETYIIPVAVSQDLSTVGLLHCVVKLTPNDYILQNLQPSHIMNANKFFLEGPLSTIGPMEKYQEVYFTPDLVLSTLELKESHRRRDICPQYSLPSRGVPDGEIWMGITFSRDGKYLAVIRPVSGFLSYAYLAMAFYPGVTLSYSYCSVAIFENSVTGTNQPSQLHYAEISNLDGGVGTEESYVGGVSKPLVFHPLAPYLAIATNKRVLLWKFDDAASKPISILKKGSNDMAFSQDGSTISGRHHYSSGGGGINKITKTPILLKIDFQLWSQCVATTSYLPHIVQHHTSSQSGNNFINGDYISKSGVEGKAGPKEAKKTSSCSPPEEQQGYEQFDNNVVTRTSLGTTS